MRSTNLATKAIFMIALGGCLIAVIACGTASAGIYWTGSGETGGLDVGRANLDGTNADPEFIAGPAGGSSRPICDGVAVDGTDLYWADNAGGTIARANVNGAEVNRQFISGIPHPCDVTIDSNHIYWTSSDFEQDRWDIGRANLDGTGVEPEFLETGRSPCALATYESTLIGPSLEPEAEYGIYQTPIDGGGPTSALVPKVEAGCGIAISGQFVYWTDFNGFIGRAKLDGSLVEPHFIQGLTPPCGLAIYDGVLYWTEEMLPGERGEISRANVDGSDLRRGIVMGLPEPCGIAVDGRLVPTRALPPPPAHLGFGRVRHNRATGAMLVPVDVSTAGSLTILVSRQQFRARLLGGSDQLEQGRNWVKVSLGPGSRSAWPRDALRRGRSVELSLFLDFKPPVGPVVPASKSLNMWRDVGSSDGR